LRKYYEERGKKRKSLTLIGDINVLETLEDCEGTAEEEAICNIMTKEDTYVKLYENICAKEIDVVILDVMIHTVENYDRVTELRSLGRYQGIQGNRLIPQEV